MKPAELKPLVGKKVECFWQGQRIGVVKSAPATDTLGVLFLPPHGRHKIPLDQVIGVYWYGKRRPVAEVLAALKAKEQPKP